MSESEIPGEGEFAGPADPELEAFFAAERARPPASDAARLAALGRVLAGPAAAGTVPPSSPPTASPPPSSPSVVSRGAAAAVALLALFLGAGLGALGHATWAARGSVPHAEAPEPRDAPEPPIEAVAPEAERPIEEAVVAPLSEPAVEEAVVPHEAAAEPEPDSLAAEMSLVSRAQTALQRGLPASALSALDEHARRFPRGELAEEREALAVQALARGGRMEEAARRAERFDARYPHSVLGPVVHAAVGEGTSP